jgi:serine/threonine protein kinase
MAEIYRAKTFGAAGFEKEFAIKLILPSLVDDTEFVNMFINEAKISVSLYHANVVQVFDLGQLDDQYYIAMEFVHGKDLLDVLARCAELDIKVPLHLVLFVTMEMLKGLDFAHRAKDPYGEDLGIIHRDVSPSNILISYAGDVKVGDFGVAKAAIQRNLTETGTLKGKVGYMSPEQVMGERIDARSDIFSAGIVFFEALSMSRLFVGASDLDVMLRVRDADIRESLQKTEPLPSDLRQIVQRSLARHREERYQSAGEFYQALVDFCFRHNIRVTESNVSTFMRRLFSEEIEEEKARRRLDPHAPMVALGDSQSVSPNLTSDTFEDQSLVDQLEQSAPRKQRRYQYKGGDGALEEPMTLSSMLKFLKVRPIEKAERVRFEGEEEWLDIAEISELSEVQSDRPSGPKVSQTAEAAVFKPARRRKPEEEIHEAQTEIEPDEPDEPDEFDAFDGAIAGAGMMLDDGSEAATLTHDPPSEERRVHSRDDANSQLSVRDVEALREKFDSYEGDLAGLSFTRMLSRLHRSKSTGRLQTSRGKTSKSTFFQNGEIIYVESNLEEERLGAFLMSKDIISQEQLREGLARLSEWGGRLGDALVATGAIPAHDIFRLLSEQMAEKLLDLFTWHDGVYGYFENQEPSTHGYPLDVDCFDILVRGCRERVTLEHLYAFYKELMHVAMYMRQPEPFDINLLKLRANELRVAKQIEEGLSLHGLLRKFPPSQRSLIYRTVYLLHQSELLTFELTTDEIHFPG